MNDPIVDWAEWGEYIPLRCRGCGAQGWSTKNIGYIGARTVFYFGIGTECNCPASQLEPDRDAYLDKKPLRQLVNERRLGQLARQDGVG